VKANADASRGVRADLAGCSRSFCSARAQDPRDREVRLRPASSKSTLLQARLDFSERNYGASSFLDFGR